MTRRHQANALFVAAILFFCLNSRVNSQQLSASLLSVFTTTPAQVNWPIIFSASYDDPSVPISEIIFQWKFQGTPNLFSPLANQGFFVHIRHINSELHDKRRGTGISVHQSCGRNQLARRGSLGGHPRRIVARIKRSNDSDRRHSHLVLLPSFRVQRRTQRNTDPIPIRMEHHCQCSVRTQKQRCPRSFCISP